MNVAAVFRWMLRAALVACLALLAFGFAGRLHPALDSFAHFRAHLGIGALGLSILVLAAGPRRPGAVGALAALIALATVWPAYVAPDRVPAPQAAGVFRLLHLNLRYDNKTPEAVFALLAREEPDIVAFNEVSAAWRDRLRRLFPAYPFHLLCDAAHGIGGVALLSRYPWREGADEPRCRERGTLAVAPVELAGMRIDVAALHLGWPWPYEQAWHVDRARSGIAELGTSALLVGDFNATPWSATATAVREAGGLASVDGLGATWLDFALPRALLALGLPIDQAMIKGDVVVHSARALEPVGSDHLPVLLEFSLSR